MRAALALLVPLLHAQQPAPAPEAGEAAVLQARVQPLTSLVVHSRLDATVARLFVQVGDPVAGLARLVELSAPELSADVGVADQQLVIAEKELDVAAADERIARLEHSMAQRRIATTEQRLGAEKAALDVATRLLDDQKRLVEAGRSPASEVSEGEVLLEQRRAALAESEAKLLDVRDELAIAAHQLERAVAAVAVQKSRIDAARAARDALRAHAGSADVTSTLAGSSRCTRLFVGPGDLVVPGSPLVELCDDSKVVVQVFVPAPLAGRVRAGTVVALRARDGAPADVQIRIARTAGVLDPESQTMLAEAEIDNREGRWLPGLELPATIVDTTAR